MRTLYAMTTVVFAGLLVVACSLVRIPDPAELERAFVGPGSNIISVDPSSVQNKSVPISRMFAEEHDLCTNCHPKPGTAAHSEMETWHFHGSRPCADCHSSNYPTEEQVREAAGGGIGLTFSHERHLERHRAECGQCHQMNVHQHGVVASMVTCRNCHVQMGGPTKCSECHPHWNEIMPAFHRNVDILKTHGEVARDSDVDCTRCHVARGYCRDCHANEMPHREGYHLRHLQEVKNHPETCTPCHGPDSCRTCHDKEGITLDDPSVEVSRE